MAQFFYPAGGGGTANTQGSSASAAQLGAETFISQGGGSGGFGEFQQGFTYGYYGTAMWTEAWLAYKQAKAQKRQLKQQAELQRLQAQAYDTAADDVKREAERQAAMISYNSGQQIATTRVAQAAAGIAIGGSGSAAEIIASQRIAADMQINQTLANAVADSWGQRKQAVDMRNQALASMTSAKLISPWAAAISTHIQYAAKMGEAVANNVAKSKMGGNAAGKVGPKDGLWLGSGMRGTGKAGLDASGYDASNFGTGAQVANGGFGVKALSNAGLGGTGSGFTLKYKG